MSNMNLQPGDIFTTKNPQSLGRIIRNVQTFWSVSNSAEYSHAGIILDSTGTTFEALWKIEKGNIQNYLGDNILIGRNLEMTEERFKKGYEYIKKYEGKSYPLHRLAFFLFPPIAKYIHFVDWGVCSELTAQFLMECGLIDFWRGVFPDYLATMIQRWQDWEIVYEGEL